MRNVEYAFSKPWRRYAPRSFIMQAVMEDNAGSDWIAMILEGEAGDIAYEFDFDAVTDADIEEAQREIYEATQRSLEHRDLPSRFAVYRGGMVRAWVEDIVPFSLRPSVAVRFAERRHKISETEPEANVYVCTVDRDDVLADVDVFQVGFEEAELLVRGDALEDCVMVTPEDMRRRMRRLLGYGGGRDIRGRF